MVIDYLLSALLLVLVSDLVMGVFYWGRYLGGLFRDWLVDACFLPSDFWGDVDND